MATVRTVKAALAAAYPDIEFTYGTAGRGRQRGHAVSWTGGPPAAEVRAAAGCDGWRAPVQHFVRHYTDAEYEVLRAKWDAEAAAREAAEPARRAAAKAAGVVKRAETAEAKRKALAALATRFPGISFTVTAKDSRVGSVAWQDGPEVAEVAALVDVPAWWCDRDESPEHRAAVAAAKSEAERRRLAEVADWREQYRARRTMRRYVRSVARRAMVARIVAKRTAQLRLPFAEPLPLVRKPAIALVRYQGRVVGMKLAA